jgi:hypothetical protein
VKWLVIEGQDGRQNVVPEEDGHEVGMLCWCRPVMDNREGVPVVVHNERETLLKLGRN